MTGEPRHYIQDEPMDYSNERYKKYLKDYRHEFEDTHCRVHYCHKGPHICPICPCILALEDATGDLEWLLAKIKKKYKLTVYRRTKDNGTWTWNIKSTKTD